ncbi:zinc ribbon domain-containing protein [Paludisphaera borealis]|uniref:C4-type zinc ribbon domain-containing protein n=1 Tax=Paludisphaera borealis TaxID=1387353 RepID=A0A1U7CR35_9BACT|nr:C4-type zinc ribbon domain-containing protein [Paludisphaera borealis]APW61368.1 hypothetical protein BSF38_02882 [Paludisphaera borealis]
MTATADALRDLHTLHQRAKAVRDRLLSGPKTLTVRQAALVARQADLEKTRKALQDAKLGLSKNEHALQASQAKIDDLKVKLNLVKKNEEYKALQNQIAHDKAAMGKYEDLILQTYETIEAQAAELAKVEAEVKQFAQDVDKLQKDLETQAVSQTAQLAEIETTIISAEDSIPIDQREQYRRVVRQLGADALAAVEGGACIGCYTSVTAQMLNELINRDALTFCKSCGRLLYLADNEAESSRASGAPKGKAKR